MPSIISLDLETTGLKPKSDAIIEIGAVRFNGQRVEDEFSTLINPEMLIPREITSLTGITNNMVRNAPKIHEVLPKLAAFAGYHPILGHNIKFDLSFLRRHKVLLDNETIDTYEMASVLLPTASRYNLEALGLAHGIIFRDSHRALEDAKTTRGIFLQLFEKAFELPIEMIAEFVRISDPIDWGASWVFRQILDMRSAESLPSSRKSYQSTASFFAPIETMFHPPLIPVEQPTSLDVEEVSSLLEYGGPFADYFESFEHRPQQVEMLRVVTEALSESMHLMVEAGTGTGKSLAYLAPAALWSIQNNMKVVISTNTINLQDQLINKDIPDLAAALDLDLRASVLKGRNNYLCPRRLDIFRLNGPENANEMRVLAKILVWLLEGGLGDRNEINLNGPIEREIWNRLSADDEGCKGEVCLSRMGGICPNYSAHQAAQSAHLIIVNHALLLADVATGSRILPDYDYLIVDEAHHIESATTNSLSFRVTRAQLLRLLRDLGGSSSGILGFLLNQLKGLFFNTIIYFLAEARDGRPVNAYGQQTRILPSTRTLPIWEEVEIVWDTSQDTLQLLLNLLSQIYQSIGEIGGSISDELYDSLDGVSYIYRRLSEIETNLSSFVSNADLQNIYWAEIPPTGNQVALHIAPLHVGPLMEEYLWHEKACIILTSATLTTHNGFDYLRNRLNADEADEILLGSPFDFETSALLYLVKDIPEPADRNNYQRAVENILKSLSKATGGRMLVLFTSYMQLRRTSRAISPVLEEAGIFVYEQGKGASPNALLENFRSAEKAVLLGTRAFWEGVDIPGEALSVLVIVKLPFDVPSDPIIAARAETFENPFGEYNLPEAVLRLRQGFGRLIRTQSDRGAVIILDRRVLTKSYGRAFIDSLPQCTSSVDSMYNLPDAVTSWLNL
jgi:DNA polymerase-3 subunit epsilon/ATP-dependent DNA helicase DinG